MCNNQGLTVQHFAAGIYSVISLGEAIVQFGRDMLFFLRCAIVSKLIHKVLLNGVICSPMSFFDTNPIGRIINRFSADIDTLDTQIPWLLSDFFWCFSEVITTIIMISYATPQFLYVMPPIIIFFVAIQRFYIVTSRQLKRLYSVSKSPLFSHFSEMVSGASVIRAFQQTDRFIQESELKMKTNVMSFYLRDESFYCLAYFSCYLLHMKFAAFFTSVRVYLN